MFTYPVVHHGEQRYDDLRTGFNLAVDHHPSSIVDAASVDDIIGAVQLAAREHRAVSVVNTGHGPTLPADDAVLLRTGRMRQATVDPVSRTAVVHAGAVWADVIAACAPHGLAPLNGSSPHVGAVGYTLGGGVGLLGRRFGFSADHVRWFDVVTADGQPLHVTADGDSCDLFWALCGSRVPLVVVVAMGIELFPVRALYGGELCFGREASDDVLHAYAAWTTEVPDEMSSSALLLRYPDDPAVPDELRGRHITHVRVAHSGDEAEGRDLVDRLRTVATPVVDTVRTMPYAEVGSIHHEPTDVPVPAFDRNTLLATLDDDVVDVISEHAGPDGGAEYLVELRAWGGALAAVPPSGNSVVGRDAAFSLTAIADPTPATRAARDDLLDAVEPWSTGFSFPNFCGVEDTTVEAIARQHSAPDIAHLRTVKAAYDPDARFPSALTAAAMTTGVSQLGR